MLIWLMLLSKKLFYIKRIKIRWVLKVFHEIPSHDLKSKLCDMLESNTTLKDPILFCDWRQTTKIVARHFWTSLNLFNKSFNQLMAPFTTKRVYHQLDLGGMQEGGAFRYPEWSWGNGLDFFLFKGSKIL